jgi:hypothetical protein
MTVPKQQSTLLVLAGVIACLCLTQPARAVTVAPQAHVAMIGHAGSAAVQPVGQSRWQGHSKNRQKRYRSAKPWRSHGDLRAFKSYSGLPYWRRFPGLTYRPWGPYEPCVNCPAFK